ncbi:MAG TPA: hypothetical protein PLD84_15170 [Chitinophagales bacterium]|nr:hypothetical protein [Chitinophagales bacterium]
MKHQLCIAIVVLNLFTCLVATAQATDPAAMDEGAVKIQSAIADDEVTIEWDTEREVNIRCFILERSADGKDFTMMAMLPAKNQYAVITHYQVNDPQLLQPGMEVQYRLKIVDMNGLHHVSTLVVEKNGEGLISSR